MTKSLEEAFNVPSRLPKQEQDRLAAAILQEIAVTERWDRTFTESPDLLERLADEALAEQRAGLTEALDPDSL